MSVPAIATAARRVALVGAGLATTALVVAMATSFIRVSVVKTGSMAPGMPAGSLLISRRVPSASLKPGDVVTLRRPGSSLFVTHRVVRVDHTTAGPALMTKGDANTAVDDWRVPLPTPTWRRIGSTKALAWLTLHKGPWAHLVVTLAPAYLAAGLLLAWLWAPTRRSRLLAT